MIDVTLSLQQLLAIVTALMILSSYMTDSVRSDRVVDTFFATTCIILVMSVLVLLFDYMSWLAS